MMENRWYRAGLALCAIAVVVGAIWYFFRDSDPASEMGLSLPLECEIGSNCFIQQYVDVDPGPTKQDYACGSATYDGHKGTDFRVRTLADVARGIPVVASAAGQITGLRDGTQDRLVKTKADRAAVQNKECGNGVVITHEDGWQTQYCHLRKGSLTVKEGDVVARGDRLGLVGYSGNASFPHVHLSVRKDGKTIDPFRGAEGGPACGAGSAPLWSTQTLAKLEYQASQLLHIGFSEGPVKIGDVERGTVQGFMPAMSSRALVAWGWAINLRKNDQIITTLVSPRGELARNTATLDRNKAQYMLFAGKKRPARGWPAGNYHAVFTVIRNGKAVIKSDLPVDLR
ncbi:M23 family metallopeptidase [Pelagibius sp. Alg239-R121]|uniref:M23 family metallopeptidase n=1 Tax=Pelagibius sp. Alg239-R121 TaxID=2993448 RepID=UPI0024A6F8DA|nr:M23 family metallopeptidase [Pelagibius sp. Alg239-R121]